MQALLKLVMNKVVALILSFGALLSIMTGGLVKISRMASFQRFRMIRLRARW